MKAALLLATCSVATAAEMTARFVNGDAVNGRLSEVREDSVLWDSRSFPEPQALLREQLVDVMLPGGVTPEFPEGDHIAVVTLTNGDELRGALLEATETEIVVRTSYAGELTFRRDMVASLDIQDRPEIYYAGPKSIEEWEQSEEGGWVFERGALVCRRQASIGRDMGTRDRFRLAFDLEWRDAPQFRLYTCADSTKLDDVGNCYELVCQSQYAFLRKRTEHGGRRDSTTIGTTSGVREFQDREKVRVEMLHDQRNGLIRLMLGGRVVADWREPAPGAAKMGGGLLFLSDPGSRIRISRIQVSSWDGALDEPWREDGIEFIHEDEPEEETPDGEEEPQGVVLRNGDRLDGEPLGISGGMVNLRTPFKEFKLPVSRLRTFSLRTAEEAANPELCWKPIRRAGDIRASFLDGGSVTFELTGFGDGTVQGRSQTFGEAEFELSAFNRIEFNIYRDGLLDGPISDGW